MNGGIAALKGDPIVARIAGHRAEFLHWGYIGRAPWRNYLHRHAHFEVCYAHSGRGTFRVGAQVRPVGAGDIFVARPGDAHEIIASDHDPLEISFWSYTLLPDVRCGEDCAGCGHDIVEAFAGGGPAISQCAGAVPALLSLLAVEAAQPMLGRHEFVSTLAGALVLATARATMATPHLPDPDRTVDSRDEPAVRDMIRYLHDNYEHRLSVGDVADRVRLSPRHAGRLFARSTGISISTYLQRLRLTAAAQRLVEHELSVKEIAHRSGYSNVHYFTTAFRQQWAETPAAFRRQNGRQSLDSR